MNGKLDEAAAQRRIQFVIDEAKHGMRKPDSAITYALRVAANFYSIGQDAQSGRLKMLCPLMSRKALDLYQKDRNAWREQTTNEHWLPVGKVWLDICNRVASIRVEDVVAEMKKYGIVVVTKAENGQLPRKPGPAPEERYIKAGIEVMERCSDGTWQPFQGGDAKGADEPKERE